MNGTNGRHTAAEMHTPACMMLAAIDIEYSMIVNARERTVSAVMSLQTTSGGAQSRTSTSRVHVPVFWNVSVAVKVTVLVPMNMRPPELETSLPPTIVSVVETSRLSASVPTICTSSMAASVGPGRPA